MGDCGNPSGFFTVTMLARSCKESSELSMIREPAAG